MRAVRQLVGLAELEDFALEAARTLIDRSSQQSFLTAILQIWAEAGIDGIT